MSREDTWRRFGVVIGSPRNKDYDLLKGRANARCVNPQCKHTHGINKDVCTWFMRDKDGHIHRCNCITAQRQSEEVRSGIASMA